MRKRELLIRSEEVKIGQQQWESVCVGNVKCEKWNNNWVIGEKE